MSTIEHDTQAMQAEPNRAADPSAIYHETVAYATANGLPFQKAQEAILTGRAIPGDNRTSSPEDHAVWGGLSNNTRRVAKLVLSVVAIGAVGPSIASAESGERAS